MRKLLVIGIGAGSPEYVTVQAIGALNRARVFFVFDKGEAKSDLVALRKEVCERFIEKQDYRFVSIDDPVRDPEPHGYKRGVETWHIERAEKLAARLAAEVADGECGAFLVWGDPSLYDSTLRLLDLVREKDRFAFDIEVIPGISSVQALAARHGLILNTIGGSVLVTTGRELAERGWPDAADSVVVMLDRGDGLRAACQDGVDIYWGALLGTTRERLVSGKLTDVIDEIERIRAEEKAASGWIMDIYLLRRNRPA
ncbi:precorrin-6A synthase (deacetylating) [Hyphomicrobium sp.]|uniref:precorrin-6A synthase (deacetylating) n=1 Tax=Hyphomicrobium sp. TaxID=82 RepID=UPI002C0F7DB7|nr:precorrin-6A synthase (deacetylating) [Hyphomicrobium sp.]HRN86979.1 precorrin-6A synthase (deacetylating) [Hyphomicrobium sp.]HRQ26667.1 precorrin-6A synthase (deacetylating) [Hyphomicrobium sp.]